MRIRELWAPGILVLLLTHGNAKAQIAEEEEDLAKVYGNKKFVSIATGSRQLLSQAPATASVITASEIKAMGAKDLMQVLEAIPGLHVSLNPGMYEPLVQIRGINHSLTPHVLFLQDGHPLTTLMASSKGQAWVSYPVQNIARVEVIRGPGSALYGADAYAGVVNIVTQKTMDKMGLTAGLGKASFSGTEVWLQHGGKWGEWETAFFLHREQTNGSGAILEQDAQTQRDRQSGTRASLAPGPVNTGYKAQTVNLHLRHGRLQFSASHLLRWNIGTGAGISSALDPVGKLLSERVIAELHWRDKAMGNELEWGVNTSFMQFLQRIPANLQLFPPGARFPTGPFPNGMIGHPDTSERHLRLSAFLNYSGWHSHKIRAGAGYEDLNMYHTATFKNYRFNDLGIPTPTGEVIDYSNIQPFLTPHRRKLSYIYLQDEWELHKDLHLTSGIRHDHYSDFGNTTNLRLAAVWRVNYELTAKFLFGTAFRAPSFSDAYSFQNPVTRGNPNARPETIRTLEMANSWQAHEQLLLNLNLFHYRMKDLLQVTPNPLPAIGGTTQNVGSQRGHGFELEGIWDNQRGMRLNAAYSWQSSTDGQTNTDVGYCPQQRLYLRAEWRPDQTTTLGGQWNYVMQRARPAGDKRPAVADYRQLDLSLRKTMCEGRCTLGLSINNVFNSDAREPSLAPGVIPNDLPLPGRAFSLQLEMKY